MSTPSEDDPRNPHTSGPDHDGEPRDPDPEGAERAFVAGRPADAGEHPTVQETGGPLTPGGRTEEELRAPDRTVDQGYDGAPPLAAATPVVVEKQRFRGFLRHRATQLVAAGVVGILIGGGTVALIDGGGGRDGGHGRSGAVMGNDNAGGDRPATSTRGGNSNGGNNNGSGRSGDNNRGDNNLGDTNGSGRTGTDDDGAPGRNG